LLIQRLLLGGARGVRRLLELGQPVCEVGCAIGGGLVSGSAGLD
jgi:hypothetical protein